MHEIMNTFTGLKFKPMEMKKEDVEIKDIAHALSLLCRGGGHLKYFYSVGQHSINCAKEAKARGLSRRIIAACLLHDASEAYIADIIRPVKQHLPEYYEIEAKFMELIFDKFGLKDLTEEEMAYVRQIDDEILEHELPKLMHEYEQLELTDLAAIPDFSLRQSAEIEKEFLTLFQNMQNSK